MCIAICELILGVQRDRYQKDIFDVAGTLIDEGIFINDNKQEMVSKR